MAPNISTGKGVEMGKIFLREYEESSSGICIDYIKSRKRIYISGWYDSCVGIQGDSLELKDFFLKLGITENDCKKACEAIKKGDV